MDGVFIAWSRLSRRTVDLARLLGLELLFIPDGPPYVRSWLETRRLLEKTRPRVVFVQLPQGPLLLRVLLLKEKLGYHVVADVHTGFLVHSSLAERILNAPFSRLLSRCSLVLAHNEPIARLIEEKLAPASKVLTVYDPIPALRPGRPPPLGLEPGSYVLVPASWAPDEPLLEITRGFLEAEPPPGMKLVITGDARRRRSLSEKLRSLAGERLVLTGYLPLEEYHWLLANAGLVIAATTREYTMLSAIWEAVAADKDFVATATSTLRSILGEDYPCLAEATPSGFAAALERCLNPDKRARERLRATRERLESLSHRSLEMLRERLRTLT